MTNLKFLLIFFSIILNSNLKPKKLLSVKENIATYFPPLKGKDWETISPSSLGWDNDEIKNLNSYLETKNTKAFIVLKDGKIVIEKYFGDFNQDKKWYWASAGKTFTAFLVGIAQSDGLLNINNKTSDYLGKGWSSASIDKENKITIKNQLTMTTGFDDNLPNNYCTLPSCLIYKADAGTRWAYHTGAYTILDKVIEKVSGLNFNDYANEKVCDKIGMKGFWIKKQDANNVFFSDARSMARFGLLLLNKGRWVNETILKDDKYFAQQINSSQNINPSYGYLTWLNGKSNYILPTIQKVFPGSLISNAPTDLYAALGKNDQKIYVIPSQNLVVIRMGNSAGNSHASLSSFDNELWGKLKTMMKY